MHFSLISRIVTGFILLLFIFSGLTLYSLQVQRNLAQQIELITTERGELLDTANTLRNQIQDANRAVIQHANSQSEDARTLLTQDYRQTQEAYRQTFQQLQAGLSDYPRLLDQLGAVQVRARQVLALGDEHLRLHEARVTSRQQALAASQAFDDEWLFFGGDLSAISQRAVNQGVAALEWEVDFILRQAQSAQAYLQRALGINDLERIEAVGNELASVKDLLTEKQASIDEAFPAYAQELAFFSNLIINAIAAPDDLFQSHRHFIELNGRSEALLANLDAELNATLATLSTILDEVRALNHQARDSALGSVSLSLKLTTMLLALGVVVSVLIMVSVVASIRKPLHSTLSTLSHLAEGDLTQRIKHLTRDEMGQIGEDVNRLAERLADVIGQIRQSSDSLAAVAANTSDISQQTLQSMEAQQAQTVSVATAVTEMEAAVREVAQNAENSRSAIAQVMEAARHNMAAMDDNMALSSELNQAQSAVSQTVTELHQESQEIGTILDVILGMAEQTNLLALNAAIEAARAGEHGRGFAVVADEVRALSNRSREAAAEIQTRITSLQGRANAAAERMGEQVELGRRTAEQSRSAGASLAEMVELLDQVNDMGQSIATASEEQSAVAGEVAHSVTQIADMAESVAAKAKGAAENGAELNQLSDEQRHLVQRFLL